MRYFLRGDGASTEIASAESDDRAERLLLGGWREVKEDVWRDWWRWRDLSRLWELREAAMDARPKVQVIGDAPPNGFARFRL